VPHQNYQQLTLAVVFSALRSVIPFKAIGVPHTPSCHNKAEKKNLTEAGVAKNMTIPNNTES